MAREAIDVCLPVLNESNKSRFDSYSVRKSALIMSHITFRDCRVHSFSDNLPRNSCLQGVFPKRDLDTPTLQKITFCPKFCEVTICLVPLSVIVFFFFIFYCVTSTLSQFAVKLELKSIQLYVDVFTIQCRNLKNTNFDT